MKNTVYIFILLMSYLAFGQEKPIDTDALFHQITSNPKTKVDRRTYSKSIVKEFYELQLNENNWTAYRALYSNNKLKEKGLFLNGDYFGIWRAYDNNGNLISEINYFLSKKIKGIDLGFEKRSEKPVEFRLTYTYNVSDSLKFDTVDLYFNSDLKLIKDDTKGLPTTKLYTFKIDYSKAKEIATSKNYGITNHQNAFKDSEYLKLIFDKTANSYTWIISDVPKTEWKGYKNTNSGILTGIGKTLRINCSTGEIKEREFEGTTIIN